MEWTMHAFAFPAEAGPHLSIQRIRGFLNDMRYINSRFTYLLTYDLVGMEGWVGLGITMVSKQSVQDRYVRAITFASWSNRHA